MFVHADRFYFCTFSTKEVCRQLSECPFIEFTRTSEDMCCLRIRGEIKFETDIIFKEKCFGLYPMLKDIYQTPNNPLLMVFYLEHGTASIDSMSHVPRKTFEF